MKSQTCWVVFVLLLASLLAPHGASAQELKPLTSDDGRFTIMLPGDPEVSETQIPTTDGQPTTQKQYVLGGPSGVYLVSFQDNPNLVNADPAKISQAFDLGRDGLKKAFGGEVLEEKAIQLLGKYPGREVRLSIPAAKGKGRCRLYLVHTRLYQVMAVGVPDFVGSEQTQTILDSFSLIEPK